MEIDEGNDTDPVVNDDPLPRPNADIAAGASIETYMEAVKQSEIKDNRESAAQRLM